MRGFFEKYRAYLLVALVAVAAALRLACIGAFPFFVDEVHAILFAKGSLFHAMRLLPETPGTAPLDYALVNILSHISTSEYFIRLPYAAAGIYSVFLTFKLCERWHGTESAFHASAIMALSTAHIFYSQSLRCYSLGILLILLVVDSYDRFFNDNDTPAAKTFIVSSALAFLNQFFMLIPLSFLLLYAALSARSAKKGAPDTYKENIMTVLRASGVLLVIFFVTWRLILMPKGLGVVEDTLKPYVLVLLLVKVFASFVSMRDWLPSAVVFVFFIAGIFYSFRHTRRSSALMLLIVVAPAPFIIFQEMRLKSGAHMRHYIYALPFYMIFASQGLKWMSQFLKRRADRSRISRFIGLNRVGENTIATVLIVFVLVTMLHSVKGYYSSPFAYNGSECDLRPDLRTPAYSLAKITTRNDVLITSGIADGAWRYVIDFYLDRLGEKRKWTRFTEMEQISFPLGTDAHVYFVYFDFPYFFERDFTGFAKGRKVIRLNEFITLFEPERNITSREELISEAEQFAYTVTPPSDYRFFAREYTFLGVLSRMKGDRAASQADIARAIDVAENGILKVTSTEAEARNEMGVTLFAAGDIIPAGEQWEQADRLIPSNISLALVKQLDLRPETIYSNRALYFLTIGNYLKAGEYVDKALAYNPSYSRALRIRARLKGRGSEN